MLDPGQRFRVDLSNELDVGTIIHWHGQIPPNAQDGVPDMLMPLLSPGCADEGFFALNDTALSPWNALAAEGG